MSIIDIKGKGKYDFEFGEPVKDHPLPSSLVELNIVTNRFKELPNTLENTKLRILKATNNAIEYLPRLPKTTQHIHMGYNALHSKSFDNIIPDFDNLQTLELNNNRLLS